MKKLLIAIPLILAFIAVGVQDIYKQRNVNQNLDIQLNQREIRLNTLQQKMLELNKELDLHKGQTEQNQEKIKELETEKQRLEAELQAKLQRKEAERIAQANLQKASVRATGTVKAYATPVGNCAEWIAGAGITDVANANELIRRESGCNPNAVNRSSGACGVAQELPCGKSGCSMGDGACQVKWMNGYVMSRYGSWANAVGFHNRNNWY